MAYGMRIWGADGALQMDENSFTMRVVFSTLVTFSGTTKQTQSFSVPGCNTANSVALLVPNGAYDQSARQHEASTGNDVVNVYNYVTGSSTIAETSKGTMRLLVVRFK
jgi:hypothetical protein